MLVFGNTRDRAHSMGKISVALFKYVIENHCWRQISQLWFI